MSKVSSAPRCTPPMPPVAKISMPARSATYIVAATVVPAAPWRAATAARSRRDALMTPPERRASRSSSSPERPTLKRPLRTAIVAGVAPCPRTAVSSISAVSRLAGYGMPWVMIVEFERDDGLIARERLGDLGRNVEQRFHVHADRLFPSRTRTPAPIAPDYQLCRAPIKRAAPRQTAGASRSPISPPPSCKPRARTCSRQCSPARSRVTRW